MIVRMVDSVECMSSGNSRVARRHCAVLCPGRATWHVLLVQAAAACTHAAQERTVDLFGALSSVCCCRARVGPSLRTAAGAPDSPAGLRLALRAYTTDGQTPHHTRRVRAWRQLRADAAQSGAGALKAVACRAQLRRTRCRDASQQHCCHAVTQPYSADGGRALASQQHADALARPAAPQPPAGGRGVLIAAKTPVAATVARFVTSSDDTARVAAGLARGSLNGGATPATGRRHRSTLL
jgi:hypothetical protein